VATWRQNLQQQLITTLGPERSALLVSGIDDHLRDTWNDLGATSARSALSGIPNPMAPSRSGQPSRTSATEMAPSDATSRAVRTPQCSATTQNLFGAEQPERLERGRYTACECIALRANVRKPGHLDSRTIALCGLGGESIVADEGPR
jgi:hypothetical protein